MNEKDNVRSTLILIEIYQRVQKYYEIDKSLTQLEEDYKEFMTHINDMFDFQDNKELKELIEKIANNTEQDIINLKDQGVE